MAVNKMLIIAFLALGATTALGAETSANPIRRVVTMLQMMQNKVEAEGEKQKELFEKFQCYCKDSSATLGASIEEANEKIPQLESAIKEGVGAKAQIEADLVEHKTTRAEATKAIEEATAMRGKENKAFSAEAAEAKSNIGALAKAIPAIEKGLGGAAFLQTEDGAALKQVLKQQLPKLDFDTRDVVTAFLEQKDGETAPGSQEILGMLKVMKEEMEKDLADLTAEENAAKAAFDDLVAAKEKEISAASAAIEEKTARLGEIAVEIVENKNDNESTSENLAEDEKSLAEIEKTCAVKTKEFEALMKTNQMEMAALADTIKLLNDDDALDLFKKTLPSASASAASFLQLDDEVVSTADVKSQALQMLNEAQQRHPSLHLDFITLALRHKTAGFGKVLKMIDDMVVLLKKEQVDDEDKKEYCEEELDKNEDLIKDTSRVIKDVTAKIGDVEEKQGVVASEIKALQEGMAALDKSVVVATAQRKEENSEFTSTMASNNAAIQLIEMAKNRMNKFYNPKMYKAPPKRELSEEERITLNMGGTLEPTAPPGGIAGTGITAMNQEDGDDSQPALSFVQTATKAGVWFSAAYKKQAEASNGVIAMMDMLINDIKTENTEASAEEEDSQEAYETMMANAKEKRAKDAETLTQKTAVQAELAENFQKHTDRKKAESDELMAAKGVNQNLHGECDWLLQNFDTRKAARTDEIEALAKCKAVLRSGGASASFLQVKSQTFLKKTQA